MEANKSLAAALAAAPPAGVSPSRAAPARSAEHRLETSWSLWYDKKMARRASGGPKQSYKDNLRMMGSFKTLEEFWRFYVHLKRPSDLVRDVNLYLFREGCTPMWEEFPDGGCWILKVKKHTGVLSKMWQDLVLGAIGECFEEPGVVGVALAIRTGNDMLSVWHRNNANEGTKFFIGEKLKTILNLDKDILVEYKTFKKASTDKSTYSNTQAYVFAAARKAAGGSAPAGRGGHSGAGQQRSTKRRPQKKRGNGGGDRKGKDGSGGSRKDGGRGKGAQGKKGGAAAAGAAAAAAPAPAAAAPAPAPAAST